MALNGVEWRGCWSTGTAFVAGMFVGALAMLSLRPISQLSLPSSAVVGQLVFRKPSASLVKEPVAREPVASVPIPMHHPIRAKTQVLELWKLVQQAGRQKRDEKELLSFVGNRTALRGDDNFPRVVAAYDFSILIKKYSLASPKRLLVFGTDPEISLLTVGDRVDYVYDQDKGTNDLHSLSSSVLGSGPAPDLAILGQTLEHLYDPALAMRNIFSVLADGAYFFASGPLTSIPHRTPMHFYHFTAMGLAVLMQNAGFESIALEQWGSNEYETALFQKMAWPGSDTLKNLGGDQNHVDFVWGLFRKPSNSSAVSGKAGLVWSCNQGTLLQHPVYTKMSLLHLWESVVKPSTERRRDVKAMQDFVMKRTTLRGSNDFPRVVALYDFSFWLDKYNLSTPHRVLTFGQDFEMSLLTVGDHVGYVYDQGKDTNDLHSLRSSVLGSGPAPDLAILGQTLEHLYDPLLAMSNVFNVVAEGAYFFTSTPLTNIPHMTPIHYFHYTSMGLAILMQKAGFEVVELGQWGATDYEVALFTDMWWPGWAKVKNATGDVGHVDQVWGLFRKPRTKP